MMKLEKIVLLGFVLASCTQPGKKEESNQDSVKVAADTTSAQSSNENPFALETYLFQGKVNGNDVQTISETSVLVVNPTDEQIEAMKKEYGEEDFYTIADDASFYQAEAISLIDSLGIKKVAAVKPFALLVGEAAPKTISLRRKGAPGWMIILFNKNKAPEIVPAIDVNRDKLKEYFDLK
ncbi:MAG TPA: hypothetical protein VGK39_00885 [Cyclobacteriaceae bacterium]